MRGLGKGVMSATTQVKVLSPEIIIFAQGQRFHFLEASTGANGTGELAPACRGLSPWRANERSILELGRTGAFHKEASKKPKRQRGSMTFR